MKLQKLRMAAAETLCKMQTVSETVDSERQAMTTAEREEFAQHEAKHVDLCAQINREEARQRALSAYARPDANQIIVAKSELEAGLEPTPSRVAAAALYREMFNDGSATDVRVAQREPGAAGRRYADLFGDALSMRGWTDSREFLKAVHLGLNDSRLKASATTYNDPSGGFSVPEQMTGQWLDAALEGEIVRPRATVVPMASKTRSWPAFDGSDVSDGTLFGGFSGGWTPEAEEIAVQTPKLRLLTLTAAKLGLLTQVSNELLADGVGYGQQLDGAMIRAIGWFLDRAFLTGTGTGEPGGVLNAACTIAVTKETGQAAATINYTNLVKMFARLHPASIQNAVWVANSTTVPQLSTLSVAVGTGGSHVPVMTESNGEFRILTRPVIFTEKMPSLGQRGDIGLFDFSQYVIGLRKDMSLDKSGHAGFTRDTTYFRGLLRADGQPTWKEAYTPLNGDSLSPFVVLGARS